MNYTEFINAHNGRGTDYDGAYGVQCVDLIKAYLKKVFGITPGAWGNAHAYYDNFYSLPGLYKSFNRITNTASFVPQKGDIAVWRKGSGFPYGHIAICNGEGNTSWFKSYDQNWTGNHDKCTLIKHNYNMVAGVLRPKNQSVITGGSTTAAKPATSSGSINKSCKWKGKVTAGNLNVRTWAGTENKAFMMIKYNTVVEVCDTVKAKNGSTWYYIKTGGKYGFVSASYIKKV